MHVLKSAPRDEAAKGAARPKTLTADPDSAQAASIVAGAMRAHGVSQRRWAGKLKVQKSKPANWCSARHAEAPNLRHLVKTSKVEPSLFGEIVRRLAELVDEPAPSTQDVTALHLLQSKEAGDYAGKLHEALLDGQIDAAELDDLIREKTEELKVLELTLRKLRAMREEIEG